MNDSVCPHDLAVLQYCAECHVTDLKEQLGEANNTIQELSDEIRRHLRRQELLDLENRNLRTQIRELEGKS